MGTPTGHSPKELLKKERKKVPTYGSSLADVRNQHTSQQRLDGHRLSPSRVDGHYTLVLIPCGNIWVPDHITLQKWIQINMNIQTTTLYFI